MDLAKEVFKFWNKSISFLLVTKLGLKMVIPTCCHKCICVIMLRLFERLGSLMWLRTNSKRKIIIRYETLRYKTKVHVCVHTTKNRRRCQWHGCGHAGIALSNTHFQSCLRPFYLFLRTSQTNIRLHQTILRLSLFGLYLFENTK